MPADDRSLSAPVGVGQANDASDVRHVQHLLNERQVPGGERLTEDGAFGLRTTMRLIEYQRDTVGMSRPDAVAIPNGPTMRALTGAPGHVHPAAPEAPAIDAYSRASLAPHETTQTQSFIQQMLPAAQAVHEKWGIPTSVTIAQGAFESGWGTRAPGNEYFGVKAHGYAGPTQAIDTHEFGATGRHHEKDSFRAYGSIAEAADDYGRFMTSQSRYRHAFEHTDDPQRFVEEVGKAKWGTDPHYTEKVNGIIKHHNLTRYDALEQAANSSGSGIKPTELAQSDGPRPQPSVPDANAYWAAVAQMGRDAAGARLSEAPSMRSGREAEQGVTNTITPQTQATAATLRIRQ